MAAMPLGLDLVLPMAARPGRAITSISRDAKTEAGGVDEHGELSKDPS